MPHWAALLQAASVPSVTVAVPGTMLNCGIASCGGEVQVLMPFTPLSSEHGASAFGKPLPTKTRKFFAHPVWFGGL